MKSSRSDEIPNIEGLYEAAWLIHESINVLEEIYIGAASLEEESWLKIDFVADQSAKHVHAEMLELLRAPDRHYFMNQSATFWRLLEMKQQKIVIFCRNRSPVTNMIFHMCRGGSRFDEDFVNGLWCESIFPFLTVSAGTLANAPIRICDARDPGVFLRVLFDAYPYFDCAVCDWDLEVEEIAAIIRMTKDSPIAFLCPQ